MREAPCTITMANVDGVMHTTAHMCTYGVIWITGDGADFREEVHVAPRTLSVRGVDADLPKCALPGYMRSPTRADGI